MPFDTNTPLVLLSGLAADARIFTPQKVAFPQLHCPAWLPPHHQESIDDYAKRLAAKFDAGPCIIGGASFGGIVALHMAKHVDAQAVILIGSIKSPSQLPMYARCARPLRFLIPFIPIRLLQLFARPIATRVVKRHAPFAYGLACQFRDSNPAVFKWSLRRHLGLVGHTDGVLSDLPSARRPRLDTPVALHRSRQDRQRRRSRHFADTPWRCEFLYQRNP